MKGKADAEKDQRWSLMIASVISGQVSLTVIVPLPLYSCGERPKRYMWPE